MAKRDQGGMIDDTTALGLDTVEQFETYEEYLDSQVTDADMYFLEDEDLARQLVELGYRGSGDTLQREEFDARKRALRARSTQKSAAPKRLAGEGKDLAAFPFLHALATREELVRNGKLASIIFIRDRNAKGQEVSGYIDYAHRLRTEPAFGAYFERRKRLLPRPQDLSYYNWETQTSTSNSTPNFQVIADNEAGLLFKNKRDRKVINVDPKLESPGDNSSRYEIPTTEYLQVVIFDHMTRRKS
mmetsp:Transcript_14550/g.22970  ORF Transcript_14550/g.22970 Transcript_14550/m.22970 type:complete len:244 (+) Transcript_14550:88-819(+)